MGFTGIVECIELSFNCGVLRFFGFGRGIGCHSIVEGGDFWSYCEDWVVIQLLRVGFFCFVREISCHSIVEGEDFWSYCEDCVVIQLLRVEYFCFLREINCHSTVGGVEIFCVVVRIGMSFSC